MSTVIGNPLLLAPEGYQISRSVRLRSSASAYFNRTPASAGNRKTWTFSAWIKRGAIGATRRFIAGTNTTGGTASFYLEFNASDQISFGDYTSGVGWVWQWVTTQVFRDPSAWYHIAIVIDTTQATSSNRVKLYVNGSQATALGGSTYPALNYDGYWNSASFHSLGDLTGASLYFDGYLTEINFIDGQALTPSSFGETDAVTGVWKPKKYAGTYGTNGFYLNFSDNSAATAAAIGKDYSGNGNNWTPNNISVTAGATYDSMLDVPTQWADGGNGRGNYCVANPLKKPSTSTITDGNLSVALNASGGEQPATFAVSAGKWYWEVSPTTAFAALGIIPTSVTPSASSFANGYHYYGNNGQFYTGLTNAAYGASYTSGDVIGVALDLDNNQITFYKNNVSQGVKTIAAGEYNPDFGGAAAVTNNINFGQRPFAYTPPTGFKALNTQNLPEPLISNGRKWFDATTYTGNGSTQSIVNSGGFRPDLVWGKSRSTAIGHGLYDSVRGVQQYLGSNTTAAEATYPGVTAFNANGFSVGSSSDVNNSGSTFVAWQWKESATAGFDIVTFTGTGGVQNISHSLGVAPKMMIFKSRNNVSGWSVYHASVGNTGALNLQTTAATNTTIDWWNNTSPTSSQFTIGANINISGWTWVGYLFAEVAGFSRFGSYTGNGSADGPFVFCGFRPRFVLFKRTDAIEGWYMYDTARDTINALQNELRADSSAAESVFSSRDFLSNGFKIRTANGSVNASGGTYIYAAFAENPFKYSLAR